MSRITHIDVQNALAEIKNLANVVDNYDDAVAKIKRITADLHGCWGDDENGQAFAENYVEEEKEVLTTSQDVVTLLRRYVEFLEDVVDKFQELDTTAGQYLEFQD